MIGKTMGFAIFARSAPIHNLTMGVAVIGAGG
jgi:hypothetical protein